MSARLRLALFASLVAAALGGGAALGAAVGPLDTKPPAHQMSPGMDMTHTSDAP